jgi:hypothetical protein
MCIKMWLLLTLKRQKQSNPCSSCRRCFLCTVKIIFTNLYSTPVIYASFWTQITVPIINLELGYYPSYYYAWNPFPIFRYRNNINICLNINNNYNYVNYRRSERAVVLYSSRRSNGYEDKIQIILFLEKTSQTVMS